MTVHLSVLGLQNIITVTTLYLVDNHIMVGSWFLVLLLYFSVSISGQMLGEFVRHRTFLRAIKYLIDSFVFLVGMFLSVMFKQFYLIFLISALYMMSLPAVNGASQKTALYLFPVKCVFVSLSVSPLGLIPWILVFRWLVFYRSSSILLPVFLQNIAFVFPSPCRISHPSTWINI